MTNLRLQKYLAECGIASRRKAEELILAGKVVVNGNLVTELGTKVTPGKDVVTVAKRVVRPEKPGIIVFHKPLKVITSKKDEHGRKTVMDFLSNKDRGYFPVGRLDYDTTGLLIMTNDGTLAERLTHPRYEIRKLYIAKVRGKFSRLKLAALKEGVELEDGHVRALVKILKRNERETVLEIGITVGRNRIIRRLFEHLGHPVLSLKRIEHGPFVLGNLKPGELKKLTPRAYERMRKRVLT